MIFVRELKTHTITIPSNAATGRRRVNRPKAEMSSIVPTLDSMSSRIVAVRKAPVSKII